MPQRFLLICWLFFLTACASAGASPQSTPVATIRPIVSSVEKPTYKVERGTIVNELKLNGNVAALQQQDLSFTINGHIKTLYVERTDVVTKGQLLAELDLGELPNQLRKAQVAYDQVKLSLDRSLQQKEFALRRAQIDLEAAQAAQTTLQKPAKATDLELAKLAVERAETDLEATRASASEAKTQAEFALNERTQALIQAQAAYDTAFHKWEHVKNDGTNPNEPTLNGENGKTVPNTLNEIEKQEYYDAFVQAETALRNAETAITQAQVALDSAREAERSAVRKGESAVKEAQLNLKALTAPPDSSELAAAKRDVRRAQLAIEEAQQGGDPELEKQLASAQLEIDNIQAQIDAGRLYAPFDGVVGTISVSPGEAVEAYKAVVNIMNDAQLEVIFEEYNVDDEATVGVGQPVEIVFSRHPGRSFKGEITRLPTSATSSASSVEADTAYHVQYEAPDIALEVGDLASITILLEKKDNVLWLPPEALRAFETRRFVILQDGDKQRRVDVKIGITTTDRVEITQGLKEGDVVVGR